MEAFYVYILYSKSLDKFYIGQTSSVESRLQFHNDVKRNKIWTKRGIPWEIKTFIKFPSRSEAISAETFIKKQRSRKTIQSIIDNGWRDIHDRI
ncbi:MAG: GIY-YIG nuclease family protein [Anditalea sp.]